MVSFRIALVAVLLLSVTTIAEASFRCGTSLVDTGDWPVEVKERCGEPDYVAVYPQATLPGIGVIATVEHWYYNSGSQRFIRRLVFRNGRLASEESLGYGFNPGAAGSCTPHSLNEGMSEYEVVARCGDPLSKRVTWQVPRQGGYGYHGAQAAYPVDEWLYEFRSTQFRRVVTFRNGHITSVDTADKPF